MKRNELFGKLGVGLVSLALAGGCGVKKDLDYHPRERCEQDQPTYKIQETDRERLIDFFPSRQLEEYLRNRDED